MKRMVTEKEVAEIASAVAIDEIEDATIESSQLSSGEATEGQVLTADGSGGVSWEDASGGSLKRYQLRDAMNSIIWDGYFTNDYTFATLAKALYDNNYRTSTGGFYRNPSPNEAAKLLNGSSNKLSLWWAEGIYSEDGTGIKVAGYNYTWTFTTDGSSVSIARTNSSSGKTASTLSAVIEYDL